MAQSIKVLENRIRATLKRRGYFLEKSRLRDRRALNYGLYWVKHAHTGAVVEDIPGRNADRFATLDDIAKWLES